MADPTLERISEQLELLTQLVALRLCDGKTRVAQIELLGGAGMTPKVIADLLGVSPNSVSVALYQKKKRAAKKSKAGATEELSDGVGEATVEQLLARANELLTVIAKAHLADAMRAELKDDKMRRLYDVTGSAMSSKEIGKELKMGMTTISEAWQRWEQIGLVVKDGQRYRRVF